MRSQARDGRSAEFRRARGDPRPTPDPETRDRHRRRSSPMFPAHGTTVWRRRFRLSFGGHAHGKDQDDLGDIARRNDGTRRVGVRKRQEERDEIGRIDHHGSQEQRPGQPRRAARARRAAATVGRPLGDHQVAPHTDPDGGHRDQRRRWRERQGRRDQAGRRRHERRRRDQLARHAAHVRQGRRHPGRGLVDDHPRHHRQDQDERCRRVLGLEHLGRALGRRRRGRRLLLPYRSLRQPAGPGTRAADPQRQQVEGRHPHP